MTERELKKRLDKIATLINELDTDLKAQYGEDAYLYFEAGGNITAMSHKVDFDRSTTAQRQAPIVGLSKTAQYDCGAW